MRIFQSVTLLVAMAIAILCLVGCDEYNIVEPRFFSEKDIIDVPVCSQEDNGDDGIEPNQNCTEWPEYRVETCLEIDKSWYILGDTVYMNYSIINLDTMALNYEIGGSPAVSFEIEETDWYYPTIIAPVVWDLVLEPGESYAESTFWDMKDTTGQYPLSLGFCHLHGALEGCHDPDFSFPMDLQFSVARYLPTSYSLVICWVDESRRKLRIDYGLPGNSPCQVFILGSGSDAVRTLVDENQEAGFYKIIWDLRNDKGKEVSEGVYGVSMKAGQFEKVIWFETD